jgi:hypothetical protein
MLRDTWEHVWSATPDVSVFMSYPFLRTWWEQSQNFTKSLFILVLKDEAEQVIGIAPLMLEWTLVSGFPMRCLSLMYKSFHIDRPQFLLPTRRDEQLEIIMRYLKYEAHRWDIMTFHEQLADPIYVSAVDMAFGTEKYYRLDVIMDGIGPYLKIDPRQCSWDAYWKSRSAKHRKKWRHCLNRLAAEGAVEITRHGFADDCGARLAEYRELEARSWKSTEKINLPDWQIKIYLSLAEGLSPNGKLHIVFLRLNRRPIAGLIGLAYGDKYAALHTSYDKDHGSNSPGFLVGGHDMKWVIESGFVEYDFMLNYVTDKLQWTDTYRTTHMIRVLDKSAWGGLLNFVKFIVNPFISRNIGRIGYLKNYFENKYPNPIESKFEKHNITVGLKELV